MNNLSRIGKVARLPHSLREQLNLRLLDHEPAKSILPWLNSLPEVKAILAAASLTHKLLPWTQLQYTSMARFIDSEPDPQHNGTPSANSPTTSPAFPVFDTCP